jgi:predicted TIM-barrel fold metal-dependent hydrolase
VTMHLLRRPGFTHLTGPQLMEQNRLYVACEVHEDLPYILQTSGEDHLIIGSDYSHADPHMEINPVRGLRSRTDVPPRVIEKILDDNARALYGL